MSLHLRLQPRRHAVTYQEGTLRLTVRPAQHCQQQQWQQHPQHPRRPARLLAAAGDGGSAEPAPLSDASSGRPGGAGLAEEGMDAEVKEALEKVQQALEQAELNVQTLHTLPSARLPSAADRLLGTLRPALQFGALAAAAAAIHALGPLTRVLGSLVLGAGVGLYGWRRSSLSGSGAAAAALVGWATLAASFRAGLVLLTFFFASSKLTQLGEELKDVDEEHKKGGQRDWRQVCCNALVPTCLALASVALGADAPLGSGGRLLTSLNAAFLGYYACCCGDTWSSELGQLSPEEPRLITTLRPVRKGTNGGVTLVGLAAALAGGLAMGAAFLLGGLASPTGRAAQAVHWRRLLGLGVCAGLAGSLIDSLLGATVQFTGYNRVTGKITGRPGPDVSPISGSPLLDNNLVNAVSASAAAGLAAAAAAALF